MFMFSQVAQRHQLGGVDNKLPFDIILSYQHFYQKVSRSLDVGLSYSVKVSVVFRHNVVEFTLGFT